MDHPEEAGLAGDLFTMNACALSGEALSIGYRQGARKKTVVAEALDLHLESGEVVCLVGPNGAGKSTLLRTLTGLQPALSGHVSVEGTDIHRLDLKARAQKIGVVLTERVNVGLLPAFDLVALGRYPHTDWTGRLSREDTAAVDWALTAVGAADLRERHVNELSDGERQKVMIARALAQEPAIVVLDEPTAFLDLPRRVEIMGLLKKLARTTNRAILLSTHDLDLAIRAADRMWLMSSRGIIHSGAPEDLVLRGELETVFAGEGVSFDREHGSFHLAAPIQGHVRLEGEGPAAVWTQRALRREGYELTADPAQSRCTVRIITDAGNTEGAMWSVEIGGRTMECASIYDVVAAVRKG
jgi:iron complex transport system ATP-binding protein